MTMENERLTSQKDFKKHDAAVRAPEEVIRVVPPPGESGEVAARRASAASPAVQSSGITRKFGRGFTITVSPPMDFGNVDLVAGEESDHDAADVGLQQRLAQATEADQQRLATPDELLPDVSLDRTESRLPGLEEMFADEELRQIFNTSDTHREVQDVLVIDDEDLKYQSLRELLQKSCRDETWRRTAANDRGLVDSLVLFFRQKTLLVESPEEEVALIGAGALFYRGRSSKLSRSFTSQSSFSRSPTPVPADIISKPAQQPILRTSPSNSVCDAAVMDRKVAVALGLMAVILKLLRNLCVESAQCQDYLFEHRFVDFLFDHHDGLVDIMDRLIGQWQEPSNGRFPEWAVNEMQGFTKAFLQFVTNAVSGSMPIKAHTLRRTFPDALIRTILVLHDAELFACFLHNLCVEQPSETVVSFFVENPCGVQVLYLWLGLGVLSSTIKMASCTSELSKTSNVLPSYQKAADQGDSFNGSSSRVWASVFLTGLLSRGTKSHFGTSVFSSVANSLINFDPQQLSRTATKCGGRTGILRLGSSMSRSSLRGGSSERGSSNDLLRDNCVERKWERFLAVSKSAILTRFFTLLEDIVEAYHDSSSLEENSSPSDAHEETDLLVPRLLHFPEQELSGLVSYFVEAARLTSERPFEDYPPHVSLESLRAVLRILASLSVEASKFSSEQRERFDSVVGVPAMRQVVCSLHSTYTTRQKAVLSSLEKSKVPPKPDEACTADDCYAKRHWPAKDALLFVGNLCHNNARMQAELRSCDGIRAILQHGFYDDEEPFMREASVFAIRCSCANNKENRDCLTLLINEQFQEQRTMLHSVIPLSTDEKVN